MALRSDHPMARSPEGPILLQGPVPVSGAERVPNFLLTPTGVSASNVVDASPPTPACGEGIMN